MGVSACDLDLRLRLGDDVGSPINSSRMLGSSGGSEQQQQLTIFYRGRICVCDATEMQARAIISMARREMDDQIMKRKKTSDEEEDGETNGSSSAFQTSAPDNFLINPELPMRRSLQRFLQKRKSRMTAAAASHPYAATARATQSQVLKLVL